MLGGIVVGVVGREGALATVQDWVDGATAGVGVDVQEEKSAISLEVAVVCDMLGLVCSSQGFLEGCRLTDLGVVVSENDTVERAGGWES